MSDEPIGPSLADDEQQLARYAAQLADQLDAVCLPWLQRLVDRRAEGMGAMAPIASRLRAGAQTVSAEVRALLEQDIAEQTQNPLELLRAAVRYPTEVLREAGVAEAERDEFARRNFPDDSYDLTPASFGDIDPALHEPGLVWGAAKAHVHLRRRRELSPTPAAAAEAESPEQRPSEPQALGAVVALSVDLMDRSKISAAFPDAALVRSAEKLRAQAASADLVLVDLSRMPASELAELVQTLGAGTRTPRVIAFGSHVDEDTLEAARLAGAEAMPRSVFFRRLENGQM